VGGRVGRKRQFLVPWGETKNLFLCVKNVLDGCKRAQRGLELQEDCPESGKKNRKDMWCLFFFGFFARRFTRNRTD